jgi:hypothetical protein
VARKKKLLHLHQLLSLHPHQLLLWLKLLLLLPLLLLLLPLPLLLLLTLLAMLPRRLLTLLLMLPRRLLPSNCASKQHCLKSHLRVAFLLLKLDRYWQILRRFARTVCAGC